MCLEAPEKLSQGFYICKEYQCICKSNKLRRMLVRVSANIYKANNMTFLRLVRARKGYTYSLKTLEKISGIPLVSNAPEMIAQWGFIRICKDCPNSYYRQ